MLKRDGKPTSQRQLSATKRWLFRGVTLLLVFGLFELLSYSALRGLNTRYPMDPLAEITAERVESFLRLHYDRNCGWVPSRSRDDINSIGARSSHEYSDLAHTIGVYGDSWTFCYGIPVQDGWPMQLEEMANRGVLNFGVNGYGTDQALIRLEQTYDRAPAATVLLCITVENINRCVNIHKAFYQARGVSPKPWFNASDGNVSLHNPFDTPEKVRDLLLEHPEKLVGLARAHDYWFRERSLFGRPWSISFPFTWQACARVPFLIGRARIGLSDVSSHVPLYHDEQTFAVMRGILRRFQTLAREKEFTGNVLIFPTLRDVRHFLNTGKIGYQPLRDYLESEKTVYLDFLDEFSRHPDLRSLYLHGKDHFTRAGSRIVAASVMHMLADQGAMANRSRQQSITPLSHGAVSDA